jgi:hypothetical protein
LEAAARFGWCRMNKPDATVGTFRTFDPVVSQNPTAWAKQILDGHRPKAGPYAVELAKQMLGIKDDKA